jgi:hypothetical protein
VADRANDLIEHRQQMALLIEDADSTRLVMVQTIVPGGARRHPDLPRTRLRARLAAARFNPPTEIDWYFFDGSIRSPFQSQYFFNLPVPDSIHAFVQIDRRITVMHPDLDDVTHFERDRGIQNIDDAVLRV